jgi:hypothetical protein
MKIGVFWDVTTRATRRNVPEDTILQNNSTLWSSVFNCIVIIYLTVWLIKWYFIFYRCSICSWLKTWACTSIQFWRQACATQIKLKYSYLYCIFCTTSVNWTDGAKATRVCVSNKLYDFEGIWFGNPKLWHLRFCRQWLWGRGLYSLVVFWESTEVSEQVTCPLWVSVIS